MHIAEIWRYPVKSMAGEPLSEAALGLTGIPGDRTTMCGAPMGASWTRARIRACWRCIPR